MRALNQGMNRFIHSVLLAMVFSVLFLIISCGGGGSGNGGGNNTSDLAPPSVPANLRVTATSTNQIDLSWDASTDNVSVAGYKIYRVGSYLTFLKSVTGTSASDSGLTANTQFCYRITAYDSAGNESGLSSQICAITLSWLTSAIDSNGDVGKTTSLAVDSNNKIHIAYYDYSNGAFKYATNVSDFWVIQTIDKTAWYVSLAVDSDNKVHISYYDPINKDLKYATNSSGSWITQIVDNDGDTGYFNSIAVDSNNKVHVCYFSYYNFGNIHLRYATNTSGSWTTSSIDFSFYTPDWTSIAIDSNNKVHISYIGNVGYASTLKYTTNLSSSWVIEYIGEGKESYSSIALDSNNKVHMSYRCNESLKYVTNASGSWNISTIDWPAWYTSIAVDSSNKIHISYQSQYQESGLNYNNLKYATNASGSWGSSIIDMLNNGNVGSYNSLSVDINNKVHISYYDGTNGDLKYAYSN